MDLIINGALLILGLIILVALFKVAFKIILWILPIAFACWLIGFLFTYIGWVGVLVIAIIFLFLK